MHWWGEDVVLRCLCCTNRAAAAVRAILYDFDPGFEAGSLDEAYLDITDYCQQHSLTGELCAHPDFPLSVCL